MAWTWGRARHVRATTRSRANDPHFLAAQAQLLQQLCPKWGGSIETMYAFARERADAAPPGALSGALIATAHIEHWMTLRGGGWFALPEIREELDRAAERSVRHPDFQRTYEWVHAFNEFAFACTRARRYRSAVPALGRYASGSRWGYLSGWPDIDFALARLNTMLLG